MNIKTSITSENDAVHLHCFQAEDPVGELFYGDLLISFWQLEEEPYRTIDCKEKYCWDNKHWIETELFDMLEVYCDIHKMKDYELDEETEKALEVSGIDPFELKDILNKALEMGMLVRPNPFNDIVKEINN